MAIMLGSGKPTYELLDNGAKLPEGWSFLEVSGVAVDCRDNVYVLTRGEHPVIVFDREGNLLRSWGDGLFSKRPHAIHVIPMTPSIASTTATTPSGSSPPKARSC